MALREPYNGPRYETARDGKQRCVSCGAVRPKRRYRPVISLAVGIQMRVVVYPHHFHIQQLKPLSSGNRWVWQDVQKIARGHKVYYEHSSRLMNCTIFDFDEAQAAIVAMHRRMKTALRARQREKMNNSMLTIQTVIRTIDGQRTKTRPIE